MKLLSVYANRHLFDGEVNGKPIRLRLSFDSGLAVRLQVKGDGQQMVIDNGLLDEPTLMGEFGSVDIADVTSSLFASLTSVEITRIVEVYWQESCVGICLNPDSAGSYYFWVDGDELHWGDREAINSHPWLDGVLPHNARRLVL